MPTLHHNPHPTADEISRLPSLAPAMVSSLDPGFWAQLETWCDQKEMDHYGRLLSPRIDGVGHLDLDRRRDKAMELGLEAFSLPPVPPGLETGNMFAVHTTTGTVFLEADPEQLDGVIAKRMLFVQALQLEQDASFHPTIGTGRVGGLVATGPFTNLEPDEVQRWVLPALEASRVYRLRIPEGASLEWNV